MPPSRVRVAAHFRSLLQKPGDPLWVQALPDKEFPGETKPESLQEPGLDADPFREDHPFHSPAPHLTWRYPDRALLLVSDTCPLYCRFCMRKRKTLEGGSGEGISAESVALGIEAVAARPAIQEVILSGGDPLMLPDRRLQQTLSVLSGIKHVRRVRIHSRVPCALPRRITPDLVKMLGEFPALHLAVHVNHPREITLGAAKALRRLARAGVRLYSQSVLLKGVNVDAKVLAELFAGVTRLGVQPYYLHHADLIPGTARFRLSLEEGRRVVQTLRQMAPELDMLHYVVDIPGGGGKIPLEGPLTTGEIDFSHLSSSNSDLRVFHSL